MIARLWRWITDRSRPAPAPDPMFRAMQRQARAYGLEQSRAAIRSRRTGNFAEDEIFGPSRAREGRRS